MWSKLTRVEQLILLGAGLNLIVVELIGRFILRESSLYTVTLLGSVAAFALVYLRRGRPIPTTWAVQYELLLVVVGAGVGIVAIDDLIASLRSYVGARTDITLLFDVVHWVSAGLMAWGGWRAWRSQSQPTS